MLLALDVGQKMVGVARSDPDESFAFPLVTLPRAQNQALHGILLHIEAEKPRALVVGIPLNQHGEETTQSRDVRAFCSRIIKRRDIKILFEDESYSTEDVLDVMGIVGAEDSKKAKSSGKIDAAAAAIILERFLKRQKFSQGI